MVNNSYYGESLNSFTEGNFALVLQKLRVKNLFRGIKKWFRITFLRWITDRSQRLFENKSVLRIHHLVSQNDFCPPDNEALIRRPKSVLQAEAL